MTSLMRAMARSWRREQPSSSPTSSSRSILSSWLTRPPKKLRPRGSPRGV
jgi:hypothetical protein